MGPRCRSCQLMESVSLNKAETEISQLITPFSCSRVTSVISVLSLKLMERSKKALSNNKYHRKVLVCILRKEFRKQLSSTQLCETCYFDYYHM